MKVKLISCSQLAPVYELAAVHPDLKAMIAKIARVSNPANEDNPDSDRLISYLLKHKHFSPFEMCNATIEIETTRDISRQLLRHRSFSFQEFSQRYANPAELEEQFVLRETRMQDEHNRQNSIECTDTELDRQWRLTQESLIISAKHAYNWAISNGIAKEQARCVLPEGNTKTRLYMNGTIRSWIHYLELRTGPETQKEHRLLALEISKALSSVFNLETETNG